MLRKVARLFCSLIYTMVATVTIATTCYAFNVSLALSGTLISVAVSVDMVRYLLRRRFPDVIKVSTKVRTVRDDFSEFVVVAIFVCILYIGYVFSPNIPPHIIHELGAIFGVPYQKYLAMDIDGSNARAKFSFFSEVGILMGGTFFVLFWALAESHPILTKNLTYPSDREYTLNWLSVALAPFGVALLLFIYVGLSIPAPEAEFLYRFEPHRNFLLELLVVFFAFLPAAFVRFWPTVYKRLMNREADQRAR